MTYRYFHALLLIVAIWRVTRLLVLDHWPPVASVRYWFIKTFGVISADGEVVGGRGPKYLRWISYSLAYVWTCMWCMSVWVGLAVWGLADWGGDVPYPWLIVAAGSGLAGVLNMIEGEHEQRMKLRQAEIDKLEGGKR